MKLCFLILAFLVNFSGCKEVLYKDSVPPPAAKTSKYTFSGVAHLGSPLANANISAFRFSGLKKGELLAETASDERGEYEFSFEAAYEGPILLEAQGGHYRDLMTAEDLVMDKAFPLSSAVPHTEVISRTNINAWTTMAVARVMAQKGFWDSRTKDLSDKKRIEEDFAALSHFLSKEGIFVNIAKTPPLSSLDRIDEDSASLRLYQSHGGLTWIVNNANKTAINKSAPLKLYEFISSLAKDMGDRQFNGLGANEQRIPLSEGSEKFLDAYTLRDGLSLGVSMFTAKHLRSLFLSPKSSFLKGAGSLVVTLATMRAPEIFGERDYVNGVEHIKPNIAIKIDKKSNEKDSVDNPIHGGPVPFSIEAFDNSAIAKVEVLEPPIGLVESGDPLEITDGQLPQWERAFDACKSIVDPVKKGSIEKLGQKPICICARAEDAYANENYALECFSRSKPVIEYKSPSADYIINYAELKQRFNLEATASSGYDLTECIWEIGWVKEQEIIKGFSLPKGNGVIEGKSCAVQHTLNDTNMPNGLFQLKILLRDKAGQMYEKGYGVRGGLNFSVLVEMPNIEIVSPENFAALSSNEVKINVKENSAAHLVDVWIEYWPRFEQNTIKKVKAKPEGDMWVSTLSDVNDGGLYDYTVHARADNGTTAFISQRSFRIDQKPPVLSGHLEDVPQGMYRNEGSSYAVDRTTEKIKIISIEREEKHWSNQGNVHFKRWINRLDDDSTAPKYRVRVEDDYRLKDVRYAIGRKCAKQPSAEHIAKVVDGFSSISITAKNADLELEKVSNEELCLSIWAYDEAGNSSNHKVKFLWTSLAPPLDVVINDPSFHMEAERDDFSNPDYKAIDMIKFSPQEGIIKRGTVIGHITVKNPHDVAAWWKPSKNSKVEMKVNFKRRIRAEADKVDKFPESMRPFADVTRPFYKSDKPWVLANPFLFEPISRKDLDIIDSDLDYYIRYNAKCRISEVAILDGLLIFNVTRPSKGLQYLSCRSDLELPLNYHDMPPFGSEPGNVVLSSENITHQIPLDFIETEVFDYKAKGKFFVQARASTDGKYILAPGEEVLVKLTLKENFSFKPVEELRYSGYCEDISSHEREKYRDRIFGACRYAVTASRIAVWKLNFLYDTAEQVSLSISKSGEVKPSSSIGQFSNFEYEVGIKDIDTSANVINAIWYHGQNERRRVFGD